MLISIYFISFFILPFGIFNKISYRSEIFPALELIVTYCLCTNVSIKYWQLFTIGLIMDQFHNMPIGSNSLALILGDVLIILLTRWFLIREYFTNLAIFCVYSVFIITLRLLIITINSPYPIEGSAVVFYYLTTILIYPSCKIMLETSIMKLKNYA